MSENGATLNSMQTTLRVRGALDEVTLCQCLHCGKLWIPSKPAPSKCPRCHTTQWNRPRVYKIAGAPEPLEKAKPRGRAFPRGEMNPYFQQKRVKAATESTDAKK